MEYMSTHILEPGKRADAGLPAALAPGDAAVARLAPREGVAAPAHVRDDLILQAAHAAHILSHWQRPH